MKQTITLIALLSLSTILQAQITIERQDFTLEAGTQTKAWVVDPDNAFEPQAGEGVVWDFSNLTLGESFLTDYEAPSSPLFPQANITEPSSGSFLGGLAVQPSVSFNTLSDTAYGNWGLIGEATDIPLAPLTGGSTDTLKAFELVVQFEQPRNFIQFPLNYGDTWSHNESYNIDYLVSVAAFGLQGVPAQQISQDSTFYEVAGYGELILPNPQGAELEPVSMEALMIKRGRVVTDNYTLGGQPAPQVMLDAFGLEQGETQITTRYLIYAKGLPRTAANIEVNSEGEVVFFTISDDIVQFINSTSNAAAAPATTKAFPNPATAGALLSVEMPAAVDNGVLELIDAHGRQAAVWPVNGLKGQIVQYTLPAHLQTGMYMYRIIENNQQVRGIGKLNIIR
ncbi:MAG TPA: T9SS type A sorting domain-containing protein [Phaeodactylibacter sp.]|nr:T9SS type A sorting domain-containing protein [Phaeodactylibacter sp.]